MDHKREDRTPPTSIVGNCFVLCLTFCSVINAFNNCPPLCNIVYNFQSAYKASHRCETVLLEVYNDIVTTIGRGNCAMLVLLDLFDAFDTIDHANPFCILEKYVGNCGNDIN